MVPLPPLRDGGCALPICPFGRACLPLISDAPDCICSPGRLWFLGDGHERTVPLRHGNFNPRAPCGARRDYAEQEHELREFQSTRPVWGATVHRDGAREHHGISIHAPRVGRDWTWAALPACFCYFNPRAPCGARRKAGGKARIELIFQSTRPVWGATTIVFFFPSSFEDFNPRAPCGARHPRRGYIRSGTRISIHAPRVGRDRWC